MNNVRNRTLINYVSPSVYELIAETPSYTRAIEIPRQKFYVKPVNVMYNLHVLITHRQNDTETVEQYLKNCNFAASAEEYHLEYDRDVFINRMCYFFQKHYVLLNKPILQLVAIQP